MEPSIVLDLSHGPDNPHDSQGVFVMPADSRIPFAYTRYYGQTAPKVE